MEIPKSHPRYESLMQREKILKGLKEGYVTGAGLIAQGRGECFDYLLKEKTTKEAKKAERTAIALLLLAKNPVISVNGNVAALVPKGMVELANLVKARIEINLFYRTEKRVKLIRKILKKNGAKQVLGVNEKNLKKIHGLESKRGKVDERGIIRSDVVLVPLEDGDRTEALVKLGKKVIAIDLNPKSRTAQKATVTIVGNVVRVIPNLIKIARELKKGKKEDWKKVSRRFDNNVNLQASIKRIRTAI